jgi:hypothetical protein
MSIIKKLGLSAAALGAAFSIAAQTPAAGAPPATPAKPSAPTMAPAQSVPIANYVTGDVVQWKGTVKQIDLAARNVVVEGPMGQLHTFTVKKDVPNLDQVKVGDAVTVDYVESIAVLLRKTTDKPVSGIVTATTVAPKGLPAVTNVNVKQVQANVTAVDPATRVVTLSAPTGDAYTVKVDPSVTEFSDIAVGDQVTVVLTDAVAVKVTK